MIRFAPALIAVSALAACAPVDPAEQTATADADAAVDPTPGECNAQAGSHFIGMVMTDELGAQAQRATGATILRAAPNDGILTMDFRPERLTIIYDADRLIERIYCG